MLNFGPPCTEVFFTGPSDISVHCRFYSKNELVIIWVDEIQTQGTIPSEFISKDEIDNRCIRKMVQDL